MSVASTYAEALFEAASQQDAVPTVAGDLERLRSAVADTPDIARVLENPEVETRLKKAAISALAGHAHPLVVSFAQVLLDRGRLGDLDEIAEAFAGRVDEAEGRIAVEVTTAVPLPDDLRERIRARVELETGRSAELTESVDPDIVGGMVLRVGGVVVDSSVRGRLEGLRRTLTEPVVA